MSGNVNRRLVIDSMIVSKSASSNDVLPGPAREQRVAAEQQRRALDVERDRTRRVPGVVDRVEAQPPDVDHLGVVDEHVVADVGQLGGVELGDGHLVAGLADRRHRLDVVPVAVRLEHPPHAEALAQLEQLLVLVGGVDQRRFTGAAAAHDEHVVLVRADDDPVHLDVGVRPSATSWKASGTVGVVMTATVSAARLA